MPRRALPAPVPIFESLFPMLHAPLGRIPRLLVLATVFAGDVFAFHAISSHVSVSSKLPALSSGRLVHPKGSALNARPHSRTVLRMALDQAIVEKYVAQASESSSAKAPNKLAKALKKISGSIAVGIEYRFEKDAAPQSIGSSLMPNTLVSDTRFDLRAFSMQLRREKASALFVDGGSDQGKLTLQL